MWLLGLNLVGAVVYLWGTSYSWAIPEEVAAGIHTVTGEPFVWALTAVPMLGVFTVINLAWAASLLRQGRWKQGWPWLVAGGIWTTAVLIDFAHHAG